MVFPNTPALVAKWCNEGLMAAGRTERVYRKLPSTLPARFAKVTRVGGVRLPNGVYDNAIILVEAWAPTENEASDLCQWIRARIEDLSFRQVDGYQVSRVDELGGPQETIDRDTKIPRYTYTTQVPVRGKAP